MSRGGSHLEGWERALLIAAAGVTAVGLIVWATGELAALAFAGQTTGTGLAEMPSILASLPDHLGDPAAAWPPQLDSELPGPVAFYSALVVCVAVAAAACRVVSSVVGTFREARVEGARWAGCKDLRPLTRGAEGGRIALGTVGRQVVRAERRASTLVIGPSQSGKTAAVAIPAILEAAGPVLAVSVKRDLLDHTITRRRRLGSVAVYDPTGAARLTDTAVSGWDPVRSCRSWQDARRVAHRLGHSSALSDGRDADFWRQMAVKLLGPLLFAAATVEGGSIRQVIRWVDLQEEQAVTRLLTRAQNVHALDAFQASCEREPRTRSSIYATAEAILEPWADPAVLASTEKRSLELEELLEGSNTLYLVAPAADQERLAPLFAALVDEVLDRAFARAAAGHPCDPQLLLVLDEVANTAPIRRLPQVAATGAAQGVQIVTVFQDLAQAHHRYGRAAETVLANHRAKLFLSGISDVQTLDYLRRALGDAEKREERITVSDGRAASRTTDVRTRPLARPELVRAIAPGQALLIYGHLPPARLALRAWHADRRLRKVAPAPTSRPGELV